MRYYTIKPEDVGKGTMKAFGKTWWVVNHWGRTLPIDVGKRVYRISDSILQIENQEQFEARLQREAQK